MSDIMLCSHNTMTYLPIKDWYLKPFRFMVQCQSLNLEDQITDNVRIFDIRIGYEKNNFVFKHGLTSFKTAKGVVNTLCDTFRYVATFYKEENFWFNITLETSKRDAALEKKFCTLLDELKSIVNNEGLKNVILCGGQTKADWSTIYKFDDIMPYCQQIFASSPTNNNKLCGLYPKMYANKHNHDAYINFDKDEYTALMIDFIEIR